MPKQNNRKKGVQILIITVITLIAAGVTWAQTDTSPKKRLPSPATIKEYVGGEAHNSYVIRARKGQTIRVQISWRREADNRAEFTVSKSADFFNGVPVKFGKESGNGKRWVGKVPETANYYIYVVAHPSANYILNVTVR